MKMKALKTFYGDEGSVQRGREFDAKDGNVAVYERRGLAVKVGKGQPAPSGRTANKAAETGPLASHGGAIGEGSDASLSPADQVPQKRRSGKSKEKPAS